MFWAVCTVSEECTDIRIGDLSARASVWHVFHSGQLGRRVARQEPGVAIAALVQNSFSHARLIKGGPFCRGRSLREFTRKLIATRKAFPILYRGRFVVGTLNEELDVKDVTWLSPTGEEMATEQWEDGNARCFGMLLDGRTQESGVKRRGSDATLLLIYNAHHDVVNFTLPSVPEGRHWQGLIDTNRPDSQLAGFDFGDVYAVTGRSLLVLGLATEDSATRRLRQGMGTDT